MILDLFISGCASKSLIYGLVAEHFSSLSNVMRGSELLDVLDRRDFNFG